MVANIATASALNTAPATSALVLKQVNNNNYYIMSITI